MSRCQGDGSRPGVNRNRPKVQSAVIHSGDGSCCVNAAMRVREQNTEEPSPCVSDANGVGKDLSTLTASRHPGKN